MYRRGSGSYRRQSVVVVKHDAPPKRRYARQGFPSVALARAIGGSAGSVKVIVVAPRPRRRRFR